MFRTPELALVLREASTPLRHENQVNRPRRANEMHHWAALDAEPQEVQNNWRTTPEGYEISSTPSRTP